ncbi:hypothetical protein ABZU86_05505 [Streptomyces sp. NPDC005271]|uniref:hypothetical protein n=1 Tax=unclassified Streptomyces TaxID=2593676 RepID=UPI00339E3B55
MQEVLLTPYSEGLGDAVLLGLGPSGLGLPTCGMPVGAVVSEALVGSPLGRAHGPG